MLKAKKRTKIIVAICVGLIIVLLVVPFALSVYIYQSNFGVRYETLPWLSWDIEDFEGLNKERYTFASNNGQMLTGYRYFKDTDTTKGVVIIAHGLGGGGHNAYMDVADHLTSNGYVVFAYDATGNDESEGDSVGGMPQGIIDLDHAVRFVKNSTEFEGLPIMLFGHSWGAYSAGSVLSIHPDIKAVVMGAGFNTSIDIIEEEGRRQAGVAIDFVLPYLSLIEKIKFGKYSSYTCIDGFENSNAGVMLIHSADDEMISFEDQFMMFSGIYQNNPRFDFVRYEDRGHNNIFSSDDSRQANIEYEEQFWTYINTTGAEATAELKTEYMNENGDMHKLFELDSELMDRMVAFYDSYTE
jgi:dienelactone hydrolase